MLYIDKDRMLELFNYNPDTGILSVKSIRKGDRRSEIGSEAGFESSVKNSKLKYRRTEIRSTSYKVHRIIYVMMTGEQPENIDHIDGNGLNNRWDNLRSVTRSENMRNCKQRTDNTSGVKGVSYYKQTKRWLAKITNDEGKRMNLGYFKVKQDAINARMEAEKKYNLYLT